MTRELDGVELGQRAAGSLLLEKSDRHRPAGGMDRVPGHGRRMGRWVVNDHDHMCFGCGKPIGDGQLHIHIPLDEWGQRNGLGSMGLGDDDLLFPFCEPCTVKDPRGWQLEAHEVAP
jgi:hypothetical protein